VLCLAAGDSSTLEAGAVSAISDSPFKEALSGPPTRLVGENDGGKTMIVPVENARGHTMGCIAFRWDKTQPPPWQTVVAKIESHLAEKLESQIRVTKIKEEA
jgi:hypothetical protein